MYYLGLALIVLCCSFKAPTFHALADLGETIELADGSQWEFPPSSYETLVGWQSGDTLKISPDTAWFHPHNYVIYNEDNGTQVPADLVDGPFAFEKLSNWIIHIDLWAGHVELQDTSTWCVHPKDEDLLMGWDLHDHILIGKAPHPSDYYPEVLINVNMDEYVRARQYTR